MRIFMAHNYYQRPGGEDESFATEAAALEEFGHRVTKYSIHNDQIDNLSPMQIARKSIWNRSEHKTLVEEFRRRRYDVAHFQNTFPLLSPAALHAAHASGLPVVQALRNYRLTCVNGMLFRDGTDCDLCVGSPVPWQGVRHRCYRGSAAASTVVASMLTVHKVLRTYSSLVDVYLALSEYMRSTMIRAGLPESRIVVKPNCVHPDPGPGEGRGRFALYVGRLSEEKGIHTLLAAWQRIGSSLPLKVVGSGPLSALAAMHDTQGVEHLGPLPAQTVLELMGDASIVVVPSEWQEPFGRVVIEAFSKGTPVIASRVGALPELVDHERTGLLVDAGDADHLHDAVIWALEHRTELQGMRQAARAEFIANYTAKMNVAMLQEAYVRARERTTHR